MMIHLLSPLVAGETIQIDLYFSGGNRVTVKAVVRKWGDDG
jgi:copper(I)-binding protein